MKPGQLVQLKPSRQVWATDLYDPDYRFVYRELGQGVQGLVISIHRRPHEKDYEVFILVAGQLGWCWASDLRGMVL